MAYGSNITAQQGIQWVCVRCDAAMETYGTRAPDALVCRSCLKREVPAPVDGEREPTTAELSAIDREMPLIRAEVALLDLQIRLMDRPSTPIDRRRIRRAEQAVVSAAAKVALAERRSGRMGVA